MTESLKRKLKTKTIDEKYEILKGIDGKSSCDSLAKNCNIPYFVSLSKGQTEDLCNYWNQIFQRRKENECASHV